MRIALVILLTCGVAFGQQRYVRDFTAGTNGVATATYTSFEGELHAIFISNDTSVTGVVSVAYSPLGLSPVVLATNSVVGGKAFYPSVYLTDSAGTALTNHPPVRYILKRDDVTVTVTGAPALSTWKAVLLVK